MDNFMDIINYIIGEDIKDIDVIMKGSILEVVTANTEHQ